MFSLGVVVVVVVVVPHRRLLQLSMMGEYCRISLLFSLAEMEKGEKVDMKSKFPLSRSGQALRHMSNSVESRNHMWWKHHCPA